MLGEVDQSYAEALPYQNHQDRESDEWKKLSSQEDLQRLSLKEALERPGILDEYQRGFNSIDQQHDHELGQIIERGVTAWGESGQRQRLQREAENFYDRASMENEWMRNHPINSYRDELRRSIEDNDESDEFMTDLISAEHFWDVPQQGVFRTQRTLNRADGYTGQTLQEMLNRSGVRNQFNDPMTRGPINIGGLDAARGNIPQVIHDPVSQELASFLA